ncbi:chemotaxis protein CheA [Paucibacter sp. Y2R2-4]|uniref:chemotaxis protein CheA n=1 Tax=Paucibacter sp. Y2R2-4 TaxID=2893553 RepID=UPI0021E3E9A2|nr:chemotaxis protein CheA [Paucibacter sp. Y2R2-4]MCV2348324.1 chemotaxis protein CheA [Paucibacter sp. Y2R2-4]
MNELLEQFLAEAKEALEGIADLLMQLESAPSDESLMVQLFRLVHTLKGNSGLFELPEMTRVLHAGEDLMDAVRNGRVSYSQVLADRLLEAMDFVGLICSDLEAERPTDPSAAAEASELARGLRALIPGTSNLAAGEALPLTEAAVDCVDPAQLLRVPELQRQQAWREAQQGKHLLWLHYQPDAECFFQGADPLHQTRLTPGLLWGGICPPATWPSLAALDAYHCVLGFELLSSASQAELEEHYRYVIDQVQIQQVPALSLVQPSGDPNGGPVYEDFVEEALALIAADDGAGLLRTVRAMLELSNEGLWLSSALRWLLVLLETLPAQSGEVRALLLSLQTLSTPQWPEASRATLPTGAPVPSVHPVPKASEALPTLREMALRDVLAFQRESLAAEGLAFEPGRLRAVAAALLNCMQASGRAVESEALDQALSQALQAHSSLPLLSWMDALNSSASDTRPAATDSTDARPLAAPDGETAELDLRMNRRADDSPNAKSLKVDQVKIERLMNLIGEMVVAKNAMPYLANRAETVYQVRELSREIKAQYAVVNRISEEMQDAIMQIRMMPVSFVMQRFPRLVRDISRRLGKEVNLVLEGQDTAADKNIIEALGDPLVHIVRNSLDHGLETTAQRLASGKPAIGTLRITARQESDRVLIEIVDDGQGIDPERIKRKALERGLIEEAQMERLSEQEAINLVFAPGFSTAEVVSDLSGRGVGMDVVRSAVQRVNGSIDLSSVKGQGTTITISLPLSMAVSNVMTVRSDGQMFAAPLEAVLETVRVPRTAVHAIKQSLTTVLRGRIVPLLSLNKLLGLAAPPLANADDELAVLVVRHGDSVVGLLVDEFCGTSDIILKPLTGVLSHLRAYSGSALMGDGAVLMVLNVKELF